MTRTPEQIYDELLVLRCQDGEKQAFELLVERWQGRLSRHAGRLCANREMAADAVQEAWLAIMRGIGKLGDPALFRPWAYRIVTHKCTDQIRKTTRRQQVNDQVAREPVSDASYPEAPTREDELAGLRRAMADLPAERRALLALHYLEGAGIAEIAIILDIPKGTVKSRLFNARKALKNALERTADEVFR